MAPLTRTTVVRHQRWALSLAAAWLTLAALGCWSSDAWEEKVAISPLIGATRIDERGEAQVDEVLVAGRYAYLRLRSAPPGVWHVISGPPPRQGALVCYRGYAELQEFRSPSLDRTFDRLIFASTAPQCHPSPQEKQP
ncbi:MAG: hypothetical protein AAFS10_06575 [Myxococcota bacterium]